MTQKYSVVDVGIKQILFDNCCTALNILITITHANQEQEAWAGNEKPTPR